jgi:hypothetical protein
MKMCFKCLLTKDKTEFHKEPRNKDSLKNKCKECTSKDYYGKTITFIQKEINHYTPDYKTVIKNLKLSQPIKDYSNSLTVGDWDSLTLKEKQYYANRN